MMPEVFPALTGRPPATSAAPVITFGGPVAATPPSPPENVAAATKKRGRGHVSEAAAVPGPESAPVDWAEVKIPDRGARASYQSGPVYWKFRSDRECWRVMYRPQSDHEIDLGNIGKRELTRLDGLPDQDREAGFREFLNRRLTEKGRGSQ